LDEAKFPIKILKKYNRMPQFFCSKQETPLRMHKHSGVTVGRGVSKLISHLWW